MDEIFESKQEMDQQQQQQQPEAATDVVEAVVEQQQPVEHQQQQDEEVLATNSIDDTAPSTVTSATLSSTQPDELMPPPPATSQQSAEHILVEQEHHHHHHQAMDTSEVANNDHQNTVLVLPGEQQQHHEVTLDEATAQAAAAGGNTVVVVVSSEDGQGGTQQQQLELTQAQLDEIIKAAQAANGGQTGPMQFVIALDSQNGKAAVLTTADEASVVKKEGEDEASALLQLANLTETKEKKQQQQHDESLDHLTQVIMATSRGHTSAKEHGEDDDDMLQDEEHDSSLREDMDDSIMGGGGGGASQQHVGALSGMAAYNLNGNMVSTHTFRKTEWDVKKLENYVRMTFGDTSSMEQMKPHTMNKYLKSFFEYAKKSDGMDYEPESLIGFMNSFERYLKTKNYPESLLRSDIFKDARNILKKKRDLVRSIGKLIRTKTKDTAYLLHFHRNLLKEKGLLSRDNSDCLLAEIYLNNMIYFGDFLKEDKAWRGNLNLVWGDMLLERDPHTNVEFLTLATYARKSRSTPPRHNNPLMMQQSPRGTGLTGSANKIRGMYNNQHMGGSSAMIDMNSPRVYAGRQLPDYCPVEAYKVYRSRRPNTCLDKDSPFYLAPLFKTKNNSKCWYKALAMSCQRLDALFYCLFKRAGVDLNCLASMSQQQQQQAFAAAQSIITNTTAHPAHLQAGTTTLIVQGQDADGNLIAINGSAAGQNGGTYYTTAGHPQQPTHHIITPVPAQVQVQVQVQVQLPQQQQAALAAAQAAAAAAAAGNPTAPATVASLLA